jgi:aminopeptidase N
MKISRLNSLLITLVFLSTAVTGGLAQAARPDFNRAQIYDVQHYRIKVSFNSPKKEVIGDTTVSLKPLKEGLSVVELDAVDLSFRSVTLDPAGIDLQFKTDKRKVNVTLDRSYGPSDTIAIRFKYTARPAKGVYFVKADTGRSAQIWTQGEPDEARHWFPLLIFQVIKQQPSR